jgi:cation:H+ antiporter
MMTDVILLVIGFALLVAGGELLVRGAVRLAERLGLSPMLIGLTVVGMGTSTPELAAIAGYSYFAYRQEQLGRPHGAAYDRALAVEETDPALVPQETPGARLLPAVLLFLAGLALVVGGGTLVVDAAISVAGELGVADEVIGLTVVAVGTSLPELVTSAAAAFRKQGDIALGNVLGSNIYNLLFIGGVTGLAAPAAVPPSILAFDLWALIGVAALAMLFAFTGGRINRIEGLLLVAGYGLYAGYTAGLI